MHLWKLQNGRNPQTHVGYQPLQVCSTLINVNTKGHISKEVKGQTWLNYKDYISTVYSLSNMCTYQNDLDCVLNFFQVKDILVAKVDC